MKIYGTGETQGSQKTWSNGRERPRTSGSWSSTGRLMWRSTSSRYRQGTSLLCGEYCSCWDCTLEDCRIWSSCLTVTTDLSSEPETFEAQIQAHHLCSDTAPMGPAWILCSLIGLFGAGKYHLFLIFHWNFYLNKNMMFRVLIARFQK